MAELARLRKRPSERIRNARRATYIPVEHNHLLERKASVCQQLSSRVPSLPPPGLPSEERCQRRGAYAISDL